MRSTPVYRLGKCWEMQKGNAIHRMWQQANIDRIERREANTRGPVLWMAFMRSFEMLSKRWSCLEPLRVALIVECESCILSICRDRRPDCCRQAEQSCVSSFVSSSAKCCLLPGFDSGVYVTETCCDKKESDGNGAQLIGVLLSSSSPDHSNDIADAKVAATSTLWPSPLMMFIFTYGCFGQLRIVDWFADEAA